jgi:uncharacterized membrane protein (UPF0127 family)
MFIVLALVAALVGYTLYSISTGPGTANSSVPASFTVNGKMYTFTYTATTEAEREAGLMNRKVTGATTMLFVFPRFGVWSFWMLDTNTSLDMVWVNGTSGKVVYVVTAAQPCYNSSACTIYTPTAQADYVIEAKAGFAASNGIAVGTSIRFN